MSKAKLAPFCVSEKCCYSKKDKVDKSKVQLDDGLTKCPKCGSPAVYFKRRKLKNLDWKVI